MMSETGGISLGSIALLRVIDSSLSLENYGGMGFQNGGGGVGNNACIGPAYDPCCFQVDKIS